MLTSPDRPGALSPLLRGRLSIHLVFRRRLSCTILSGITPLLDVDVGKQVLLRPHVPQFQYVWAQNLL
ncbi:hypothetical protein PISMIDRAFT_684898 [Pisolithus microcarpus 441]|uniref:Uncharacterized protein n=1 Tax=Pisolithus microcarpus 441 TaxID=765257 RepID=A0A0C9Z5W7_9AGAM|nr:hypothetical protein PISMIDRAFT_684898 [Pisolithus microcarpus 441]